MYRFNTTVAAAWTGNSPVYARHGETDVQYHYGTFEVTVSSNGTYIFTCNSSIDSFGYLYNGSFFPASPSLNLFTFNDDGGGNGQFRITADLQTNVAYVLVATTYNTNATGSYDVTASGFARVNLIQTNYMTTPSIPITLTNGK